MRHGYGIPAPALQPPRERRRHARSGDPGADLAERLALEPAAASPAVPAAIETPTADQPAPALPLGAAPAAVAPAAAATAPEKI
ncbi:MAG: hypothetical protein ACRDU4_15135, partial [Mycobacterium sp.]